MTIFITIFSGVITFVIGQIIVKLLIDPVQEMKKTIGQISYTFSERANVISNPGVHRKEIMDETSELLRRLSSQIHAHIQIIPLYDKIFKVFGLPSKSKLYKASSDLICLSNNIHEANNYTCENNEKLIERISNFLDIYISEDSRRI